MSRIDFTKFPKIEQHVHLNGTVSDATLLDLSTTFISNDFKLPVGRSLSECFVVFDAIHKVTLNPSAVERIAKEAVEDAYFHNILHLELRTTAHSNSNMSSLDYLEAVIGGIHSATVKPFSIVLILCLDRSKKVPNLDSWFEVVHLINNKYNNIIRGIDLAGNPTRGSSLEFIPFFQRARSIGLFTTMHFSEVDNINDNNTVLEFKPDRLGHAVLHPQGAIDCNIPVELCFSSNLLTESASSHNHPVHLFNSVNHPFSICTDDPGVFKVNYTDEYATVFSVLKCDLDYFVGIVRNSINFCFVTNAEKQDLLAEFDRRVNEFRSEINEII
ncbi:hypothetical protein RCL1_004124 [Eukaryota sp. TZLM3-RCL]